MILVKGVEDRAALAKREARERVSRVEVERTAALASTHEEAGSLFQKIAPLEGDL
jgi:hypothetical protein